MMISKFNFIKGSLVTIVVLELVLHLPWVHDHLVSNPIYQWHTTGHINGMYCELASYVRFRPRKGDVTYGHNAHGFHSPEIAVSKPPETKRIAFLGESSTYDAGNVEETYPYLTNLLVSERYGTDYINAGAHVYTTTESLLTYHYRLRRFSPDLLVIYHGRNDLLLSGYASYQDDITDQINLYGLVTPLRDMHKSLAKYSYTYMVFHELLTDKAFRHNHPVLLAKQPKYRKKIGIPEVKDDYLSNLGRGRVFEVFNGNIEVLCHLAAHDSVKILLVGFDADFRKVDSFIGIPNDREFTANEVTTLTDMLKKLNAHQAAFAQKYEHVYYLDLYGKIPREYFLDDCHLNPEGIQVKSKLVADFILENIPL